MSRQLRTRVIGVVIVSACGFTAGNMATDSNGPDPAVDSAVDAYIPDAGLCATPMAECIGSNSKLRKCEFQGQPPVDIDCPWSCLPGATPHCGHLVPSGGVLTAADLDSYAMLQDKTLTGAPTLTINTDDGSITPGVRTAGEQVINGIEYTKRGTYAIFRFNKLEVNGGTLNIRGTRALAIVSITDIKISSIINVQGDCTNRNAGPGGGRGGTSETAGSGSGSGGAGTGDGSDCSGGGGGAHGGSGGDGGNSNNNGTKFGSDVITMLTGGGGGGGGGGDSQGADGGGGGGAIQLAANGRVTITALPALTAGINAGGCGGQSAQACGGGGGAGGTILIEAPVIDLRNGTLAVNGGGGGGGSNGIAGDKALLSSQRASGGRGGGGGGQGNSGGDGGDGGDDQVPSGGDGESQNRAGGGGGGVGRMRFNTLGGSVLRDFFTQLSPPLSSGSTTTQGMAVIQ